MKRETEYWPTILIMTGRPYVLKKLERKGVNNPCKLCDLRYSCNDSHGLGKLYKLCTSDDRDDAWYFEEDWNVFDKPISDYLVDKKWLNDEVRGYHDCEPIYQK